MVSVRANFAVGLAVDTGANENNARRGIGRMECQCYGKSGMNADPSDGRTRPERGLPARFHAAVPQPLRLAYARFRTPGITDPIPFGTFCRDRRDLICAESRVPNLVCLC